MAASSSKSKLKERKQSAFVFLVRTDREEGRMFYAVRNRRGEIGAPGGKKEPSDACLFQTALREFKEETGADLELRKYQFFALGDSGHMMQFYYRHISKEEADRLPVGPVVDGGSPSGRGGEVETFWAPCATPDRSCRYHIAKAIAVYLCINRPTAAFYA